MKKRDLLLLFILSLVPLLWYGFNFDKLIFSNDTGYFLDPINLVIKNRIFAWNNAQYFGSPQVEWAGTILYHGLEALLTWVFGSLNIGQFVYSIIWFFLPMAAMYFTVKKIPVFREKPYMGLFAAILYQFNFFQLAGWKILWRSSFSVYIAQPLIFLLLLDYFENKRSFIKTVILFGLVTLLFNGAGSPPLFGSLILLIFTTIIFYLLINIRSKELKNLVKKSVFFILGSLIISFVLSSYWTVPYLYYVLSTYSGAISELGGPTSVINWTDVISENASALNLFRLQGLDYFDVATRSDYINIFLTNPFLIVGSFIWPILAFMSLWFTKKSSEKRYVTLVLVLTFVGLVFTAGSHPPFRAFFILLLKTIPGFAIFRSAIYKFGSLLWFSYAVLVAYSLSSVIEKISFKKWSKLLPAVFIIFILLWDFPIFTRKIFDWNPSLTTLETIPSYVFDFGKWAQSIKRDNQRILLTPGVNQTWNVDTYKWKYWGLHNVPYLASIKPVIVNHFTLNSDKGILLKRYYDSLLEESDDWKKINPILGIKYFLQRNDTYYDLDWVKSDNPEKFERRLEKIESVAPLKEFDKWKIYEIDDKYFSPHFYIPRNLIFFNGDSYDFINNLSLLTLDNHYGIYFSPASVTSFTPELNYTNVIILPGNPCCSSYNKLDKNIPEDYKVLVDKEGVKTVFIDESFIGKVPKESKYKILLRSGTPFTNGRKIIIQINGQELGREISSHERKSDWIELGEMNLPEGNYSLSVITDGNPIRSLKAGDIILVNDTKTTITIPTIQFERVNNTKYRIHVSGAYNPYTLIFSESYNPDWKLYLDKKQITNNKEQERNIIASYYDGLVEEREHSDSYLNKDIFETLWLSPLPNSRHTLINGYANAWFITPEDSKGLESYELIVEYFPQRIFYYGAILSISTVLIAVATFSYLTFKRS